MSPTETRKKWIWTQAGITGLIVLGCGIALLRNCDSGAQSKVAADPMYVVTEGPMTISVTESGTINPREKIIIKNEIEGQSTILYLIPEGTRVAAGELLVELDASELEDRRIDQEISVQNGEAAFIQARENLAVVSNQAASDIEIGQLNLRFADEDVLQYVNGEHPNTLREHQARIILAQEEARRAEETLKWSQILFDEKYIADSELQADRLSVRKAALDVELATNSLSLLENFTYLRRVAELKSDARQASMALERTTRKASADIIQAEATLRAKEAEYKRQTSKLEKLVTQIGKAKIYAPREGLVVYATSTQASWRHSNTEPLSEGQSVRERQELIHLPTASTFLAEVKLHESNLEKVKLGLPVRITVGALPGQRFTGSVAVIAPLADATSMFMNPDLKLYSTEIHVDEGSTTLRTGMSCEAEILIAFYPSAIYVPVQSVVRVQGHPTVYVRTKSGLEARQIDLGLDNSRMVRVLKGLEPGEEVSLTPPLKEGTTLRNESITDAASERIASANEVPVAAAHDPRSDDASTTAPDAAMREKFNSMTPEQRDAFKARRQKAEAAGASAQER